ncbi:MAG: hypothetical protein KO202_05735 [Methanobacteriaceae archaeon]|nr:hypothetical protein [Methanobacteriaceae archaeon]
MNNIIKLIIQLENQAKAQMEQMQAEMNSIRNTAKQVDAALDSIDGNGLNQVSNNAKQADSSMDQVRNSAKGVDAAVDSIDGKSLNQVRGVTTQVNSAMTSAKGSANQLDVAIGGVNGYTLNQATVSAGQLDTTIDGARMSANQADTALDRIDGSGFSRTSITAEMLRAILLILLTIAQQLNIVLNTISSKGLDKATIDAKELDQALKLLNNTAKNTQTNVGGIGNSARTTSSSFGFLRTAASMTAGMIGYDLVNSMAQAARESINAAGNIQSFGKRLGMSKGEINTFKGSMDKLQETFQKVDMNAVGAAALEMGVKFKIPKQSMADLAETMAVTTSAFVREGRTQTDAILAISDAMDGQWKRMLELGIKQEDLMKNGWSGDLKDKDSLLKALNKTLEEMGFTDTAKQVQTLDEAWQVLTVAGGQLLSSVLIPLTPVFIDIASGIVSVIDGIKSFISNMQQAWNALPDWAQLGIIIGGVGVAFSLLSTIMLVKLIPSIVASTLSFINMLLPLFGVNASALTAAGGFTVLAGAIWATLAPVLPFIAAAVLIAVAIFEIGKAFGWWTDVSSMIEAISDGIRRLWESFVNSPQVIGTIESIRNAWQSLVDYLGPAFDQIQGWFNDFIGIGGNGEWDFVRSLIDAFSALGDVLGFVWSILEPIISLLIGTAIDNIQRLIDLILLLIDGFNQFIEILIIVGEFLTTVFAPVWELISQILNLIWIYVQQIITIFDLFMQGQISLPEMLSMIWNLILQLFITIFNLILQTVIQWVTQLVQWAIQAGLGFLQGIGQWLSQLPGRIYNWLLNVLGSVASWASNFVAKARQAGSDFVNGVINYVKNLPQKVYDEFVKIGTKINDAVSNAVEAAKNFGKDIKDAVLNALGIHSPGIIQESVLGEIKNTIIGIIDSTVDAGKAAYGYGKGIVDNFRASGADNLGSDVLSGEMIANQDMNIQQNVNTDEVDTEGLGQEAMEGLNTMGIDVTTLFGGMNEQVGFALMNMDATTATSFANMLLAEQSNMGLMQTHMSSSLLQIVNYIRNSMNNAVNLNNAGLNTMLNSTTSVTTRMVSAWNTMKNSIINAASEIRSQATSRFNQLSSTIGEFYGRLQNPSRWGHAGGGGSTPSRRSGGGMNVLKQAMGRAIVQKENLRSYIPTSQLRINNIVDPNSLDHIAPDGGNVPVIDLIRSGALNIIDPNLRAGWSNTIPSNTSHIKNVSRDWNAKGPVIDLVGGIDSGLAFKVRDFEDGTANYGGMESFTKVAEAIFSRIGYDYYYNSDKTGHWLTALQTGSVNCWDGASALIALANVFGLSGSMGHGSWGKDGHVWAMINGRKFDTTGFSKGLGWTPSQSAGPAPKNPAEEQNNILENILKQNKESTDSSENNNNDSSAELTIKGKLEIIHDFLNLPNNISKEEILRLIKNSLGDDKILKALAENTIFQKYDNKEKIRVEKQLRRGQGV